MSKKENLKRTAALSALMAMSVTGSVYADDTSEADKLKVLAGTLKLAGAKVDTNNNGTYDDSDFDVTETKYMVVGQGTYPWGGDL